METKLRLPPGFRFHPTDEELVVQYLKRKVLSHPLPASIIPEVHICNSDPWDLPPPGESGQETYFFTTKQAKYPNGNRSNRATASGYWKATGLDKQVVSPTSHQLVGFKKTLVFYTGKPPKGSRTDWIMHEYRLLNTFPQHNWVLCRIFFKRRANKTHDAALVPPPQAPLFYDFISKAPASSCSGSSGITQISHTNRESDDHQEESSSCNTKEAIL